MFKIASNCGKTLLKVCTATGVCRHLSKDPWTRVNSILL